MTETEIETDFRLLGPFEVRRAGLTADAGGGKRRGVLAMLLLAAPLPVTVDQLIEALWADAPPRSALNLLQGYVSDWRRALEPQRPQRTSGQRIASVGGGYRIAVDDTELDVRRFEELVRGGKEASEAGDLDQAVGQLERALAEWRGAALADFAGEPFHAAAAAALDGARLDAIETLADLDLQVGRPERALELVTTAQPGARLRERLAEIHMLALYQLGRQSDALRAYEQMRLSLREELGVDPGSALRDLHLRVLRQDPSLAGAPPPPASVTKIHRIPTPLSTFVGRRQELESVLSLVGRHRLVTLTGPGGTGKTRLALRAAGVFAGRDQSEVAFVDLSIIPTAELVSGTIADALDLRLDGEQEPVDALAAYLSNREMLLILDNFEHVLAGAVDVTTILKAAPGLRVLATSREPLALDGEVLFPLSPLPLPAHGTADVQQLRDSEAVRLFLERAGAASGLSIRDEDLPVVGGICRRLDGLPLALELAAPWTRTLSLRALLERLDHALGLLTLGPRDQPERHRTLRAAIDWSYGSLPTPERALLDAMSVFRSAVRLDAVSAVADDGPDALAALSKLVDKNLVARETDGPIARFRVLETIREYAAEQLAARPDDQLTVRDRHAAFFRQALEEAASDWNSDDFPDDLPSEAQAESRAAFAHLTAVGATEACLALALDALPVWGYRGHHLREGFANLLSALDHLDGSESLLIRAAGAVRAAHLALALGDPRVAGAMAEKGIQLARRAGDRCLEAAALHVSGSLLQWTSPEEGWRRLEEAIAVAASVETPSTRWAWARPVAVRVTAACALSTTLRFRAPDRAMELLREALAVALDSRVDYLMSYARQCLGFLAVDRGEWSEAESLLRASMTPAEHPAGPANLGRSHEGLAELAWASDQLASAAFHARRATDLSRESGHAYLLSRSAGRLVQVMLEQGQLDEAAAVLSEADQVLRARDPGAADTTLAPILARLARLRGSTDQAAAFLAAAAAVQPADDLRPERVTLLLESALLAEAGGDVEGARAHADLLDREADAIGLVLPVPTRRALIGLRDRLASLDPNANRFGRVGDGWTVTFAGVTARCPDSKGMHDLARLLRSPYVKIPAPELVGGEAVAETHMGADPVLDLTARASYRRRLQALEDEENRADAAGDAQWSARVLHEREQLHETLRSASGLAGRSRLLGDGAERARKAVTARLRDAINRVERHHNVLGAHLRESIRTGQDCSYAPQAETSWFIQVN